MIAWLINFKESRIKFPDQPEKFMESEMELHDAVQVSPPPSTILQKIEINQIQRSSKCPFQKTLLD